MIQHDYTFEQLAKAPVKQTDVEVVKQIADSYGYYDDTPYWTSSDFLMSVDITASGAFLGVVTKKAAVKLLGIVETASAGDIFQVRLGLYDSSPGVEDFNYISQGFYIVDTVEYNYDAGSTLVTMYDHMWVAKSTTYADPEISTGLQYPASITTLAQNVASAIGVTLMPGFEYLPNADYQILVDPYATIANVTIQTVIQEIAAATGTTARITDATLFFVPYALNREAVS